MTRLILDVLNSVLSGKYHLRSCPVRSSQPHFEVGSYWR